MQHLPPPVVHQISNESYSNRDKNKKNKRISTAVAALLVAIASIAFGVHAHEIVKASEPEPEVTLLTAESEIDGARALVDFSEISSSDIKGIETEPLGIGDNESAGKNPEAPFAVTVESVDEQISEDDIYDTLVSNTYLGRLGSRALMVEFDEDKSTEPEPLVLYNNSFSSSSTLSASSDDDETSQSDVTETFPTSQGGQSIDSFTLSWVTEDTVDDGDISHLYLAPSDNSKISVRMKMRYSLSGQNDYAPGSITFTIPAHVYQNRNGNPADIIIMPIPESPSDKGTWNYTLSGDSYKITNVRAIKGNTKGYMEFLASGISPSSIADETVSGRASASCVITFPDESAIGASTPELTSTLNTDASVTSSTIRSWTSPQIVSASSVPQAVKDAAGTGDEWYVLVRWYSTGYVNPSANTEYSLSVTTQTTDGYKGYFSKTGFDTQSDVITGGSFTEPRKVNVSNNQTSVYYPLSQFEEGINYSFGASATYALTMTDHKEKSSTAFNTGSYSNWSYHTPKFNDAGNLAQHYNIGNSRSSFGNANGLLTLKNERALNTDGSYEDTISEYSDLSVPYGWETDAQMGYHGRYKSALNDLRDGQDAVIGFTARAVARPIGLTYESDGSENSQRKSSNYGKKTTSTSISTTGLYIGDPTLSNSSELVAGTDYEIAAVSIPTAPSIGKPYAINIDENGNYIDMGQDMTISYTNDSDKSHIPDIIVTATVNGSENVKMATVSYKTGSASITCANGASIDRTNVTRIVLPANTTYVQAKTADNACVSIDYRLRVDYRILGASENVKSIVNGSFDDAYAPMLSFFDTSSMQILYGADQGTNAGKQYFEKSRQGYGELCGYTTDTRALLDTTTNYDVAVDNDSENSLSTVHYSTKMTVQSFIEDDELYTDAMDKGKISAEKSGTFYELLPKGMTLDKGSISIENGGLSSLSVKHDWCGTGRDLVIAKVDIVPVTGIYDEGAAKYRCQEATLSFTCSYPFSALRAYGETTHIVSVYRSDNASIGSVGGYRGENDDPNGTNNLGTSSAFAQGDAGDEEKRSLSGLGSATLGIDDSSSPIYLYAGRSQTIDIVSAAEVGVKKYVMVNGDAKWSSGTETVGEGSLLRRDAFVGGTYSYRLVAAPSMEGTEVSGVVFYDALDDADVTKLDVADPDAGTPDSNRWCGTLAGVDVSALRVDGVDAKIYYSSCKDLVFAGSSENSKNDSDCDLSNRAIWIPVSEWERSLSDVKAIAVDASKKTDGSDYSIAEGDEASVTVRMKSPSDVSAFADMSEARALNSMFVTGITTDIATQAKNSFALDSNHTRTGLIENVLHVMASWNDDDDRDGKRPNDSVEYEIWSDGKPTGQTIVLENDNNWSCDVVLPPVDENGDDIAYTFVPVKTDGTPTGENGFTDDYSETMTLIVNDDGSTDIVIVESHLLEKISITGQKLWSGDDMTVRPEQIVLIVKGSDGSESEHVVRGGYAQTGYESDPKAGQEGEGTTFSDADADISFADAWTYEISGLNKYYDHGREIEYTVEEKTDSAASYIHTVDGTTITNEYHPYGTIVIETSMVNATKAAKENKFTYVISVKDPNGGEDADYKGEMHGEIVSYDSDGRKTITPVTITSGSTVKLGDGDRLVLEDVPEYHDYSIYQYDLPGFENTLTETDSGTVLPNQTVTTRFENTYSSSASVALEIEKRLDGRKMTSHKFVFDVHNMDGSIVKSTSNNGAPAQEGEGNNIYSQESFSFGAMQYSETDDGKTYEYRINERQENAPGYEYDTSEYIAHVTLSDNGDGTMDSTTTWTCSDGTALPDERTIPLFRNAYKAEGELTLEAVKKLTGGTLAADMFTFDLYCAGTVGAINSDGTVDTSRQDLKSIEEDGLEPIATTKNAADGRVTFEPVKFGSNDANKVIRFFIMEKDDVNADYVYDKHVSVVDVYVYDNNKGKLEFTTDYEVGEVDCPVCGNAAPAPPAIDVVLDDDNGGYPWTETDGVYSSTNAGKGSTTSTMNINVSIDAAWTLAFDYAGSGESTNYDYVYYTVDGGEKIGKLANTTDVNDIKWSSTSIPLSAGNHTIAISYTKDSSVNKYADKGWVKNIHWVADNFNDCEACDHTGKITCHDDSYVFENSMVPGRLAIEKHVDGGVDESQTFKFRIDLKNDEGKPVDIDISKLSYDKASAYAVLTDQGALAFVKRIVEPSIGDEISITWEDGTNTTETIANVYSGFEERTSGYSYPSYAPWYADDRIEKVVFVDSIAPKNTSYWFYKLNKLQSIDNISRLDTSNVTSMSSMFNGCSSLSSLDVSGFDISKVSDMGGMFQNCSSLSNLDVSDWDTRSVTSMTYIFRDCSSLTNLDISRWNTSNVKYIYAMFQNCKSLTSVDVSGFDTSKITDMSYMFSGCSSLSNLDVSGFDTSNVTNMKYMFSGCSSLSSLDVNNFNTSKVTSIGMEYMFSSCSSLSSLDLSNFNTSNVTSMGYMFRNCAELVLLDLSNFNTNNVTSMTNMFYGCSSLVSLDLSGFDTSKVTDMSSMFYGCSSLSNLDVSGFDTSNVTNMNSMFRKCSSLVSLDLSGFDTSKITDMSYMFYDCSSLIIIYVSDKWTTVSLTVSNQMFYRCFNLVGGAETVYSSSHMDAEYARIDAPANGQPGYFTYKEAPATNTDVATFTSRALSNNVVQKLLSSTVATTSAAATVAESDLTLPASGTSGDEVRWEIDENGVLTLTPTNGTFGILAKPVLWSGTISSTKSTYSCPGWWDYREQVKSVVVADGSTIILPQDASNLFAAHKQLEVYTTSGFDTSNTMNINKMFGDCSSLASVDLSGFDTSKVTSMSSMFYNCSSLTSVDLSGRNTSDVTSMGWMFYGCSSLVSVDVSGFDTSKVTSMSNMFYGCFSLSSLDVSGFDTSNVLNMSWMFRDCKSLSSLDVSEWSTSNVLNMSGMFLNCKSLSSFDVSGFNTSKVTDMSFMFDGCSSLSSLDVSGFDTSNVTNMRYMFYNCSSLTSLNVSEFDTNKVTYMSNMFDGCRTLRAINLGVNSKFNNASPSLTFFTLILIYANETGTDYDESAYSGTLSDLLSAYDGTRPGWYKTNPNITITYNKNSSSATGTMSTQTINCDNEEKLASNGFANPNKIFSGWSTKSTGGVMYKSGAIIPPNTIIQDTTLYAIWKDIVTITEISEGAYEVEIPANYRVTLEDLIPAGTSYTVTEILDSGWTMQSSENATGIISPNETSVANFTNAYTPATTQAFLNAYKTVDGRNASEADAYSFKLYDITGAVTSAGAADAIGTQIETVNVSDGGNVVFNKLVYGEGDIGDHYYRIDEHVGSDFKMNYDVSARYAKVSVYKDSDGTLSAVTEYLDVAPHGQAAEANAGTFENNRKPGELKIEKRIAEGSLSDGSATDFTVTASFVRDGKPLVGSVLVDGMETTLVDGEIALVMHGGDIAIIGGIPDGYSYSVTEIDPSGWSVVTEVPAIGTVTAGEQSDAIIESKYSVNGLINILPHVTLAGRLMETDEFSFELIGASGTASVAYNSSVAPDDYDENTDFADMVSDIGFPSVSLTGLGDVTYSVSQVIPDDAVNENGEKWSDVKGLDGAREHVWRYDNVTYDTSIKHVTVNVTDNGDGTLSHTVSFVDGDDTFHNIYIAPVELPFSGSSVGLILLVIGMLLVLWGIALVWRRERARCDMTAAR